LLQIKAVHEKMCDSKFMGIKNGKKLKRVLLFEEFVGIL